MTFIVAISGRRGSGKTLLAERLATTQGFAVAAFGDVVRAEALKRGLPLDVESLQQLGITLLNEWGVPMFCNEVLKTIPPARDAVLEGIRHLAVLDSLKATTISRHQKFVAIFVEASEQTRRRRLGARDNNEGSRHDRHAVEAEVEALRGQADLVIDGESANPAGQVTRYLRAVDKAWRPGMAT